MLQSFWCLLHRCHCHFFVTLPHRDDGGSVVNCAAILPILNEHQVLQDRFSSAVTVSTRSSSSSPKNTEHSLTAGIVLPFAWTFFATPRVAYHPWSSTSTTCLGESSDAPSSKYHPPLTNIHHYQHLDLPLVFTINHEPYQASGTTISHTSRDR